MSDPGSPAPRIVIFSSPEKFRVIGDLVRHNLYGWNIVATDAILHRVVFPVQEGFDEDF
jgi:hypothetical protein